MTPFDDLVENLTLEEKAAAANAVAVRIRQIENLPDGLLRGRIFAAATLIIGAEAMREFEGPAAVAAQLRRVADRLEDLV